LRRHTHTLTDTLASSSVVVSIISVNAPEANGTRRINNVSSHLLSKPFNVSSYQRMVLKGFTLQKKIGSAGSASLLISYQSPSTSLLINVWYSRASESDDLSEASSTPSTSSLSSSTRHYHHGNTQTATGAFFFRPYSTEAAACVRRPRGGRWRVDEASTASSAASDRRRTTKYNVCY